MYQSQVKAALIERRFRPIEGWAICVSFDVQERGKGFKPDAAKQAAFAGIQTCLAAPGVTVGSHCDYPAADLVAEHLHTKERWVVEVEGHSSGQPGDKVYSAVGQLLTRMRETRPARYGLAVHQALRSTVLKIPDHVRRILDLTVFVISPTGLEEIAPR